MTINKPITPHKPIKKRTHLKWVGFVLRTNPTHLRLYSRTDPPSGERRSLRGSSRVPT